MILPTRYEEIDTPLDGGMGTVMPCYDSVLERRVAIKVLQNITDPRRIVDEISALLKMRSKHVVQVYDVLKLPRKKLGIVQEFVDGEDLVSARKAISSVLDYYKQLWQIASGISDIHELNVIHRDIKPNNMKIDPEGVIKIFDFGLARDDGPSAGTIGFAGTHGFAAPELYTGIVRFTKDIDTYAFGVTALFLATETLPPELMERPPRPSSEGYFASLPLDVASEISSILDACLAENPKDRPAMSQVRNILSRHLLSGQHKALVVYSGKSSYLDTTNRSIKLHVQDIGKIQIQYNDLDFRIQEVDGEIYINNQSIESGDALPGACVITFGRPSRGTQRRYVTIDLSHPEIVL